MVTRKSMREGLVSLFVCLRSSLWGSVRNMPLLPWKKGSHRRVFSVHQRFVFLLAVLNIDLVMLHIECSYRHCHIFTVSSVFFLCLWTSLSDHISSGEFIVWNSLHWIVGWQWILKLSVYLKMYLFHNSILERLQPTPGIKF